MKNKDRMTVLVGGGGEYAGLRQRCVWLIVVVTHCRCPHRPPSAPKRAAHAVLPLVEMSSGTADASRQFLVIWTPTTIQAKPN